MESAVLRRHQVDMPICHAAVIFRVECPQSDAGGSPAYPVLTGQAQHPLMLHMIRTAALALTVTLLLGSFAVRAQSQGCVERPVGPAVDGAALGAMRAMAVSRAPPSSEPPSTSTMCPSSKPLTRHLPSAVADYLAPAAAFSALITLSVMSCLGLM